MKINETSPLQPVGGADGAGRQRAVRPASAPSAEAAPGDVRLSETASQAQALQGALAEAPDVDMDKVNAIRSQLASGALAVNPDRIADGILKIARDVLSSGN